MPESWSATPKTPKLPLIARISLTEKYAPERVKFFLSVYAIRKKQQFRPDSLPLS